MRADDVPRVLEIERACFSDPWSGESFLYEIRENRFARNYVMRSSDGSGRVDAYAMVWFIEDEAQINNIAVAPECRREGLGRRLMELAIARGRKRGCRVATLQVRPGNAAAIALYESLGFGRIGRRRNYYSDTGEDALVMALSL